MVGEVCAGLAVTRPAARFVQHGQQPRQVQSGEEHAREDRTLPAVVPENHDEDG